jgi:TRAP-type C4-dicarboxylate transport system permease small subunit
VKRLLFALFLAVVASGISFYLILFCSLSFYLFVRGLNPTESPGLVSGLRNIALPISFALGIIVFLVGIRRKDSRSVSLGQ